MAYFPVFVDLKERECLVVGGGKVAYRKVVNLLTFEGDVTLVAVDICDELKTLADEKKIRIAERAFRESDCDGKYMVIAATNNKETNREIAGICRKKKILVNAVDQIEDCEFIFPSFIKEGDVVAAFSSSGKSPVVTQYLKENMKKTLTPKLALITEILGDIRDEVKHKDLTEKEKKDLYNTILHKMLESDEEIIDWV